MRVFVTGATGFIGSAVLNELITAGHEVVGLARSEASAKAITAAGARAHIGSFEDADNLRKGAAGANGAIHLAFFHKISDPSFSTRLRIFLGGSPGGIVSRFLSCAVDAEKRAIETLGAALTGSDRALVVALPTMILPPGVVATEKDAPHPLAPGYGRAPSEQAALALAARGIRGTVVRLAPAVHDPEKLGLVSRMIDTAKKKGHSAYIDAGTNHWSAVHRLDAARLFRLALENGEAGSRYHAVAEESITVREIAQAIGRQLNVPVVSKSRQEADRQFGFLAPFIAADNPVSSQLTQELLGWRPVQSNLLTDIENANAFSYLK